MKIRRAKLEDLPQMLLIYQRARQFMKETGNPNQWKDSYPEEALVKKGILEGKAWLCVAEGPEDGREGEEVHPGGSFRNLLFCCRRRTVLPGYRRRRLAE